MALFRNLLIVSFLIISIYTIPVIAQNGVNFMPLYLSDIFAVDWRGQLHLDFTLYLILSGLWVAWRHGFSGNGLALGAAAAILGMPFFAAYLLVQIGRSGHDVQRLALGVHAVQD